MMVRQTWLPHSLSLHGIPLAHEPAMMPPTIRPSSQRLNKWGQPILGFSASKTESSTDFSLHTTLPQAFCYSSGKATNTELFCKPPKKAVRLEKAIWIKLMSLADANLSDFSYTMHKYRCYAFLHLLIWGANRVQALIHWLSLQMSAMAWVGLTAQPRARKTIRSPHVGGRNPVTGIIIATSQDPH